MKNAGLIYVKYSFIFLGVYLAITGGWVPTITKMFPMVSIGEPVSRDILHKLIYFNEIAPAYTDVSAAYTKMPKN